MTYRAAHALRRTILEADIHASVRWVDYENDYVVRIIWMPKFPEGKPEPLNFHSVEEWQAWKREHDRRALLSRPRSPLDILTIGRVGWNRTNPPRLS